MVVASYKQAVQAGGSRPGSVDLQPQAVHTPPTHLVVKVVGMTPPRLLLLRSSPVKKRLARVPWLRFTPPATPLRRFTLASVCGRRGLLDSCSRPLPAPKEAGMGPVWYSVGHCGQLWVSRGLTGLLQGFNAASSA